MPVSIRKAGTWKEYAERADFYGLHGREESADYSNISEFRGKEEYAERADFYGLHGGEESAEMQRK